MTLLTELANAFLTNDHSQVTHDRLRELLDEESTDPETAEADRQRAEAEVADAKSARVAELQAEIDRLNPPVATTDTVSEPPFVVGGFPDDGDKPEGDVA